MTIADNRGWKTYCPDCSEKDKHIKDQADKIQGLVDGLENLKESIEIRFKGKFGWNRTLNEIDEILTAYKEGK